MVRSVPHQNAGSSAKLYAVVFACLQITALLAFVFVSALPWFIHHNDDSRLLYTLGYSLRLQNQDCDILLYGDSTALMAMDPTVIQAKTGLRACNISEQRAVHYISGSYFPLDQYLAHNARPKVLLTYWSAAEFHPEPRPFSTYMPEGLVYALQFNRGAYLWKGLLTHPSWLLSYSLWVEYHLLAALPSYVLRSHQPLIPQLTTRDARGGLWVEQRAPQTHCFNYARTPRQLTPSEEQAAFVDFRKRYAVDGTKVIVDVSAWPDCAMDLQQLLRETSGKADNKLEVLPIRDFNTADIHLGPAGSTHVSEELADQVLAALHSPPAQRSDLFRGEPTGTHLGGATTSR